ncbi:MarR family transcriptional regulator [Saccharibacillus sp. CPCC 101409]|uniref:MarR family winged helix-turn-helix transcriptional regulator n=1 Tax=Saccharibacillus sp. CPCC 101409 TaxID=3058041 RepID=UPI002671060D|nr:MarR family transcriptional regulator [Saccharibacillus sp. CPCC 101409]MDO3409905.1 MarR family transcriptional regulator [Saccharibacillus sp. CPCC 101409]
MDRSALFQKFLTFTSSVHEVSHELTRGVKNEDVTPVQYKILEYMMFSQPVTPSEIADCVDLSLPNTSRELRKLTEKGLCEKTTDNADRRRQLFRLSADGQAMMGRVFAQVQQGFEQRIDGLTEEELQELEKALELLQSKVFR